MSMSTIALDYASRGWHVFPVHSIEGSRCTCGKNDCTSKGKHPLTPNGVSDASVDVSTITGWWQKWPKANIAIATGSRSGLVVVDVDPRHGGDESWQALQQTIGETETVQSLTGGGGYHLLFEFPAGKQIRNATALGGHQGIDIRATGGYIVAPPSNHLSGRPYQWEVSHHPDDIHLAPFPEPLLKLCQNGTVPKATEAPPDASIPEGTRDVWLTKMAGAMRRYGMSEESIVVALMAENQKRCHPPLPEKDVRRIAKSVGKYPPEPDILNDVISETRTDKTDKLSVTTDKPDKHPKTLTRLTNTDTPLTNSEDNAGKVIWRLVDEWLRFHKGESFDLDTICRQLDVKDRVARHHVVKKLSYEVNREELEKSDKLWRSTNKEYVSINWLNATPSPPLVLQWPYGIDDNSRFGFDGHVLISPGDIIVIAGVSNTGKTSWALNFLWNNMDAYPCTLMGNEYEAGKFKRRVDHMTWENPLKEDGTPKFELIRRYENWHDIIRPDNINIIDWINLGDNFYSIGKIIERIQSKLKTGIAVVVIQKAEGKTLGLGGGFSQHLASLYLSIDFGRMTVMKAKDWYGGPNPNGKIYAFNLEAAGCKFSHIREVAKCRQCSGAGKTFKGECGGCAGQGFIEVPKPPQEKREWGGYQ